MNYTQLASKQVVNVKTLQSVARGSNVHTYLIRKNKVIHVAVQGPLADCWSYVHTIEDKTERSFSNDVVGLHVIPRPLQFFYRDEREFNPHTNELSVIYHGL